MALTDLKDFQRVVALIPKYLGAHQPTAGFVALKVGRSFADLARFRASLRSQVFARSGVVSLGVKESANRVEIGISNRSVEPEVRGVARSLGIPDEAVAVVEVPEARVASHTLQQQHPSAAIEGGWQISNSAGGPCTLGFPAIRVSNGTNVFVTNSHCTTTSPGFDGGTITQPSGTAVGSEILDPAAWACGIYSCRNADAALILASRPLQLGKIARTTERTDADISAAALTIDHLNPTFTISGRNSHVYENEILDKVGRTTGWSYGAVEDTCTDHNILGWVRLCSDRVDFAVQDGDSGSPVFYWTPGGTAELRGIVFGWQGGIYNDGLMSDLYQIELDLGALSVHPVIGTISGPSLVPENSTQMWTAVVSGGKAPFTYSWLRDGGLVSTSSSYTGNTGFSGFQLQLNVSDALGGSSVNVREIQVTSCPPPEITC